MVDRSLQHALEAQRRLDLAVVVGRHQWRRLVDEFDQLAAQLADVGLAGLENFVNLGNVQQRQQQVLDRHEFMTSILGVLEGFVEAEFEFAG